MQSLFVFRVKNTIALIERRYRALYPFTNRGEYVIK